MKQFTLTMLLCFFSLCAFAQQITVTGQVTDAENNPLIGAAVVVVGTTNGVVTDLDGKYSIQAASDQSLKFSYVGYQEQTVKVGGRTLINVTLQEGEQLDEVVVIGYGTARKSSLSGAVASVSSKDLMADVARSASSALQGKIAGVNVSNVGGQPGSGMNINIRGVGSVNNTNEPLVVIDGVYGDINLVDPAVIQSIEVLKDASAAAIYGSRAANGVVLITTKGGMKETKAKVSANVYTGFQTVTKKLDVMNADQWTKFMIDNYYSADAIPEAVKNWKGGAGTDWHDEVFRTAPVTKASVALSGGSKNATYSVTGGYLNQEGVLRTTGYEAFNLHAKNTFSFLNNHLRMGSSVMMKFYNKDYDDFTITDVLRQNPIVPVYDPENKIDGFGGIVNSGFKNISNPLGYLYVNDFERHGSDVLINAWAEVDLFVKGLKYKLNVGINRGEYTDSKWKGRSSWGDLGSNNNASLDENIYKSDSWLVENTLHYDRILGKHEISAMVGYSAQDFNSHSISAHREGYALGAPHTIDAGPNSNMRNSGSKQSNSLVSLFGRVMYNYADRYMMSASVRRDGSSRFADGHRYGWFPSASAAWNIAKENFFEDWSDTMNDFKIRASYGVLGNQEIGNYRTQAVLGTGMNYIIGDASWQGAITNVSWVSPQNLTWEKSKTWDVGVDLGFFNNKLALTADYYVKRTEDILMAINMAGNSGLKGSPTMNAGTVENKGFEIALTHRNTIGELYYFVGVNASTQTNELKEITIGQVQQYGGYNPQGEGTITWAKVGYPIGGFWVTKTDGLFQSKDEVLAHKDKNGNVLQPTAEPGDIRFVDINGDGQISPDDRQYCGSPFPKWNLGLNMGGAWKGFDLNLFFDGSFGQKIYNYTRARMESTNEINNYSVKVLDSWTPQNTHTDMPRFSKKDAMNYSRWTDRWLEDGDFFRLKTLEFGYTLPRVLTQKICIDKVRVYTTMDNLFTITGYKGYSPDLGANDEANGGGSGIMTSGCDHGRYPLARTISFGIQVDF